MSENPSNPDAGVLAVGYLRRSSAHQEMSLEQQRAEIDRYAAERNYRIVQWYTDDAISGDATDQRRAFQRMHHDACNGGKFQTILCWDQDRFGRFDSVESGYWIHPLRLAGVRLETVTEGPVDWSDFTGRVIYSLRQEAKHQFLYDLARRTVRGQTANVARGSWNGRAPYGFDRGEFDAAGHLVRRLQPGDRKGTGHTVRLVPAEDERIDAVRYLFQRYADADVSRCALARELERAGYPSPTGRGWSGAAVRAMLRNPVYCGTLRWGTRSYGKYAQAEEPLEIPDGVPAIIDRDVFQRVQAKLARNTRRRGPRHGDYPLVGLIYCGHCGKKMWGRTVERRGKVYIKYCCQTNIERGSASTCGYYTIDAKQVLGWLVPILQRMFLGPGREELVAAIRAELEAAESTTEKDTQRLAERVRELDQQIDRLRKAIARIDDEGLVDQLKQAKRDREEAAAVLAQIGAVTADSAEKIADGLWQLASNLDKADSGTLRELLGELVYRITCWWDTTDLPSGRKRYVLREGHVELRDNPLLRQVSRNGKNASTSLWETTCDDLKHGSPPK